MPVVALVSVIFTLAIAGLLMPIPVKGRIGGSIGDMVHAPLFAGLTWAAIAMVDRLRRRWPGNKQPNAPEHPGTLGSDIRRWLVIGVAICLFGLAIEFVQRSFGRSASIKDAVANGLGVALALAVTIGLAYRTRFPNRRRMARWIWVLAGFLLAIAWWRPVSVIRDVMAVGTDFPVLSSFETKAELGRWYFKRVDVSLSTQATRHRKRSAQMTFRPSDYATATLVELRPDWTGMRTLEVDITLDSQHAEPTATVFLSAIQYAEPGASMGLVSNHEILLRPGETVHTVINVSDLLVDDTDQPVDLKRIEYVELQMRQIKVPTTLYVDFLRLRF